MAKKSPTSRLHKPVSPIISIAAMVGIVFLAVIVLFMLHATQNSSSVVQPTIAYTTPTPTLTPIPVDTSTWKTYTDWKYGYSVKLPPEFYSDIPGKGMPSRMLCSGGEQKSREICRANLRSEQRGTYQTDRKRAWCLPETLS